MTPTTPSARTLSGILSNLSAVIAALPITHLTKAKRAALGPNLFTRARELTDEVALILIRRPGEFPEHPAAGEQIDADQQAADGYLELHYYFSYLAEACLSSYQHHQSEAVLRSKNVLRSVLGGAKHPELAPHLRHQRRVSLLRPAFEVLFGVRPPRSKAKEEKAPTTHNKRKGKAASAAARREQLADLLGRPAPTR